MSKKLYTRRKRRRENSKFRFGKKSVRRHTKLGGRTGLVWSKRTKSKAQRYSTRYPNTPDASSTELSLG